MSLRLARMRAYRLARDVQRAPRALQRIAPRAVGQSNSEQPPAGRGFANHLARHQGNHFGIHRLAASFIICFMLQVWCDWLLCHSLVWNPPPSSRDYHVG